MTTEQEKEAARAERKLERTEEAAAEEFEKSGRGETFDESEDSDAKRAERKLAQVEEEAAVQWYKTRGLDVPEHHKKK